MTGYRYVICAVIGILFIIIGIIILFYFWDLERQYVITFREPPIEVNLTDENPIFIREIGLLGQNDEVYVKYNFSRGGVIIGLIGKEQWEALVKEGQEKNITKLISYSNDTKTIPPQITTEETKDPETSKVITITRELPVSDPQTLIPKGRAIIQIEILYASKTISGNISGYIEYEIRSYPNKGKYWFCITLGVIILGAGLSFTLFAFSKMEE
jgi:hypothetical protein